MQKAEQERVSVNIIANRIFGEYIEWQQFIENLEQLNNYKLYYIKLHSINNEIVSNFICKLKILITVESACILSAETIGILFYKYSILLSIPVAMLAGALTIVTIEVYKNKSQIAIL